MPTCAEASEISTTPGKTAHETGISTEDTGACCAAKASLTACTMDARDCRDISKATNGPEVDVEAEEMPSNKEVTGVLDIAKETVGKNMESLLLRMKKFSM